MTAKQPKNPALKNFSQSDDANCYDQSAICSVWKAELQKDLNFFDAQFNRSLLDEFPDLFNEKASIPYFEQAPSEDEKRAMQTNSYNSQKRLSMDRKPPGSTQAAQAGMSGPYQAGAQATPMGSATRHSSYAQQFQPAKKPVPRQGREEGGSTFRRPHEQDPWASAGKGEMGMFDEHGVFKTIDSSAPSNGRGTPLETGKESSIEPFFQASSSVPSGQATSTKPVFERLREKGSLAHEHVSDATSSYLPVSQLPAHRFAPVEQAHEDKWLYRDPSGNIQGPFSNKEMFDWFQMGYFPPTLPIKRVSDPGFESLGQIINRIGGNIPFVVSTPPPMLPMQGGQPIHPQGSQLGTAPKPTQPTFDAQADLLPQMPAQVPTPSSNPEKAWDSGAKPMAPSSEGIFPERTTQQRSNAPRDPKTLEDMLMKDLGISKQPKPKEQPSVVWNVPMDDGKQAPAPTFDEIQSQQLENVKPHEKSAVVAPTKQTSSLVHPEPSVSNRTPVAGTAWNTAVAATPVKSLDEIQQEEAGKQKGTSKPEKSASSSSAAPKSMSEILQGKIARLSTGPTSSASVAGNALKPISQGPLQKPQPATAPSQSKTCRQPSAPSSRGSLHPGTLSYELTEWCRKELKSPDGVDIDTFVSMLLEFSSAREMKNYIEEVLGISSKSNAFATEFIHRAKSVVPGLKTEEDEYVVVSKKGRKNK